jgi:hypothetical protein
LPPFSASLFLLILSCSTWLMFLTGFLTNFQTGQEVLASTWLMLFLWPAYLGCLVLGGLFFLGFPPGSSCIRLYRSASIRPDWHFQAFWSPPVAYPFSVRVCSNAPLSVACPLRKNRFHKSICTSSSLPPCLGGLHRCP